MGTGPKLATSRRTRRSIWLGFACVRSTKPIRDISLITNLDHSMRKASGVCDSIWTLPSMHQRALDPNFRTQCLRLPSSGKYGSTRARFDSVLNARYFFDMSTTRSNSESQTTTRRQTSRRRHWNCVENFTRSRKAFIDLLKSSRGPKRSTVSDNFEPYKQQKSLTMPAIFPNAIG